MTLLEQGVQATDNPTSPKSQKNVRVKEPAPVPSTASSQLMFYEFWKWKDFAPCTALRAHCISFDGSSYNIKLKELNDL